MRPSRFSVGRNELAFDDVTAFVVEWIGIRAGILMK